MIKQILCLSIICFTIGCKTSPTEVSDKQQIIELQAGRIKELEKQLGKTDSMLSSLKIKNEDINKLAVLDDNLKAANTNLQSKEVSSDAINPDIVLNKKVSKTEKTQYVYFTILGDYHGPEFDPVTQKIKSRGIDYSRIYAIVDYSYDKKSDLEFCLTVAYKEITGDKAIFVSHVFESKGQALAAWNGEDGPLFQYGGCIGLQQNGVLAL